MSAFITARMQQRYYYEKWANVVRIKIELIKIKLSEIEFYDQADKSFASTLIKSASILFSSS